MTRINPNSSIRSGYTFEDLHVLKYCVAWLLDPEAYANIQIQNVPVEIDGKGFAIDDVTITRSNGVTEYYQLKHKQHPERDLWDFTELVKKGLSRWIRSFLNLNNMGPVNCGLITNGFVCDELALIYTNERFDRAGLAVAFPELYSQLSSQFKENELEQFFLEFSFKFNEPGISVLESSLRDVLYKQLKVTKAGVDSLLLYIISEGRAMYPRPFLLEDIRNCLSWDNPRPLNQNFEIPVDFEFFDRAFHERLLSQLRYVNGGIKVFTGKPGSGKSTYLSKLYSILRKSGIMTFRHHYHLNPKDASFAERLNTDRVREALKAEFKKQKNSVLGKLGEVNTEFTPIREFIDQIAEFHREKGTTFVLIVDGLDHVIREGKNRQTLADFLNEILYPQAGFWLIFGTQEMATHCFPKMVEDYAARDEWTEIKGLGKAEVLKIAKKGFPDLAKMHKEYLKECAEVLFRRCAGNPLHLRYILTEIKNSGSNLSGYDMEQIAPYGGDISVYYGSLWNSISELAKSFCFAITALDFKLHKEQLFSLGAHLCRYPAEISTAYRDVAHLIRIELSGISVYHNSFQVFMGNQPELKEQQKALYITLKNWLQEPAQEALRWSEYAKIEYYLGNPEPLMELNRDWVISSYLDCHSEYQIEKLLNLACRAAFEFNIAEKVVDFTILATYFGNRNYNLSETLDPLWSTAFRAKPDLNISYPDFSVLSHYQIKAILIQLKHRGLIEDIPDEAIERMNFLFKDHNISNDNLVKDWIEVLLVFSSIGERRTFNFLKQFRKSGGSAEYWAFYVRRTIQDKGSNREFVLSILKLKLLADERNAILEELMHIDLRTGLYEWKDLISERVRSGYGLWNYYVLFSGLDTVTSQPLPLPDMFPDEYEYYSNSKSQETIFLYESLFDAAYFSVIRKGKSIVKDWLNSPSERWPIQLAKVIVRIAMTLADHFSATERIKIRDIIFAFDNLRKLDFSHDYKIYELKRVIIPHVIDKAAWLAQLTNVRNKQSAALSKPEFDMMYHNHWYFRSRMFDLINANRVSISEEALNSFKDQEIERFNKDLIPFADKAKEMMNLTVLYKDFQNGIHLPSLLRLTAENILAYGYHKDMFMYNILQGLEILLEKKSAKISNNLTRLMPYVYYIEQLTDGDETRHFMSELYKLVAKHDIQLLFNFYLHRLNTREYFDSDLLWSHIIPKLDLNDPIAAAVLNTAIDHSGFTALEDEIGKPGVESIIEGIKLKFGDLDYSGKDRDTQSEAVDKPKDYSHIKILPGNLFSYLTSKQAEKDFTRFDERAFLTRWSAYWLKRASDTAAILKEIRGILADKPWDYGEEVLGVMYQYAISIDSNLSFEILCWQTVSVGGWNSNYMTPMAKVRPIWKNVIDNFPHRVQEFYNYTITNSGLRYGDEFDYVHPMPKSIQFFADAGQLATAEQLMDYYLDTLDELFPNVTLPVPEFWQSPKSIQPFDLLLSRFECMSPLIRCRAAESIAELMIKDCSGDVHQRFYEWLNTCELESVACNGLMVIVRSLMDKSSYTFKHLGQLRIGGLLKIRCMATDLLQMRIADMLGVSLHLDLPLIIQMNSENPEIDLDHFKKLISRNVTLSYLDFLDTLEEESPFPVWQAWLCMYKERCDEMGLIYGRDDERYENEGQSVIVGRSTIFAEILKSTFFALLDGLYDFGIIDYGTFYRMTLKNLPVDPSVWSVSPGQKPAWWPVFEMPILKPGDEYPELEKLLTEAFEKTGDLTILSMNATYFNGENFYTSETYCTQEVIAFAYPSEQPPKISADQIFKEISNAGAYFGGAERPSKFGTFDSNVVFSSQQEPGYTLQPLSAELRIYAHHIWEHFRLFHPFKLLHPMLTGQLKLQTGETSIDYLKDGKILAQSADFLSGLRHTMNPHVHLIPYSNYLTVETGYLFEFLEKQAMKLAYVIKEEFSYKDKPYLDQWPKPVVRFKIRL